MMANYLEEHGYDTYRIKAEATLKPCPFCGGKAIYHAGSHYGYDEESGYVFCESCSAKMRVHLYGYGNYDPLHAFDDWNRRVGDDS